jgi:ABC-2 type transport system ATP-binding protein
MIAFTVDVPVIELRPANQTGLEEIFLQLIAETQRDTTSDNQLEGTGS